MNLVVTGATSFLGRALVKELARRGHRVYAVVRPDSGNRELFEREVAEEAGAGNVRVVPLDMDRFDRLPELIPEDCQIFFHFGWDGSGSENRKNAAIQGKNVTDSLKALEAAGKLGCRRFLFSGSQAEYGLQSGLMTEETPCEPVSEYGRAKLEFGRRAGMRAAEWNREASGDGRPALEYIHVRIFSVYGPGDHPWSLVNTCLRAFQAGQDMELGDCTQLWNYLYIDDLAKGLAALAFSERTEGGVYNLAGDREATAPLKDYVEAMYRLCGGRGRRLYGRVPPNAEGQAQLNPDIAKLRKATGWKPEIGFEEGIRRMLKIEENRRDGAGPAEGRENRESCQDKRTACLVCGHPLPRKPLLRLEGMPASAQNIPDREQVARDRGISLNLCRCGQCGLVQFDCRPVDYYRDVIRSGGYSTTMAELRTRQYRHLIGAYHLEGKKILEVGCGQGEFLKTLSGFPVRAFGVEHRTSLAEKARQSGLWVTDGFTETADTVLGTEGPYDAFLSFNFLEHQPEPGVMLDCIYNNLAEDGVGLITVPSLEYILNCGGYYELIRDHMAYYTFETLRYPLERHGFQVLEEETVNRDTLSVIVRKRVGEAEEQRGLSAAEDREERSSAENQRGLSVEEDQEEQSAAGDQREVSAAEGPEKGAGPEASPDFSVLGAGYERIRRQLEVMTAGFGRDGRKLALWGASHQGFTLAATTCLGERAAYIIDSAPFKQGRFAPASHLPIVPPEYYEAEPAEVILIVAPGYTEEIYQVIRSRFGTGTRVWTLRGREVEELR